MVWSYAILKIKITYQKFSYKLTKGKRKQKNNIEKNIYKNQMVKLIE